MAPCRPARAPWARRRPPWAAHVMWCCLGGRLAAAQLSFSAAPSGTEVLDEDRIESARLYGNINKYAYYFTDLLIGRPNPQRVSVIVDTGSSLCGFPCKGCAHCGRHIDPPFDIEDSKSARWIACGQDCQGTCLQGHCYYTQSYTEGSSISGFWFQDEVSLGDALQGNPPVTATMGCHGDERNLFYTQRVNGILGMAPHRNSGRPTILQDLFTDKRHVNPDVFSMCLNEWGGELVVGGWNRSNHVDRTGVQWIPLSHTGYYSVKPQKLLIGGMDLGFRPEQLGKTLVDSGTTFTYFPQEVFGTLTSALIAACEAKPSACGARRVGRDCWRLDGGAENPGSFPSLALTFIGGEVVQWPPRAYLFQREDPSLWCHAFADNGAQSDTVLGVSWMIHKDVIFDLEHSRLGVAEALCPSYYKAPGERLSPESFQGISRRLSWHALVGKVGLTLAVVLCGLAACFAATRNGSSTGDPDRERLNRSQE